jgi:hypothetical protein
MTPTRPTQMSPNSSNLNRCIENLLPIATRYLSPHIRYLIDQFKHYRQTPIQIPPRLHLLLRDALRREELSVAKKVGGANQLRIQIPHIVSSHQIIPNLPLALLRTNRRFYRQL